MSSAPAPNAIATPGAPRRQIPDEARRRQALSGAVLAPRRRYLRRARLRRSRTGDAGDGGAVGRRPRLAGAGEDDSCLWRLLRPGSTPASFQRMPIAYERAARWGRSQNPAGVNVAQTGRLPNLVNPLVRRTPPRFGPISRYWPARTRLLRPGLAPTSTAPRRPSPKAFAGVISKRRRRTSRLTTCAGMSGLFLMAFIRHCRGCNNGFRACGEWQSLTEGVQAARSPASRLAGCHTLAIDGDPMTADLVWRGSLDVQDTLAAARIVIAGGIDLPGAHIAWPSSEAMDAWVAAGVRAARSLPDVSSGEAAADLQSSRPCGDGAVRKRGHRLPCKRRRRTAHGGVAVSHGSARAAQDGRRAAGDPGSTVEPSLAGTGATRGEPGEHRVPRHDAPSGRER